MTGIVVSTSDQRPFTASFDDYLKSGDLTATGLVSGNWNIVGNAYAAPIALESLVS